VSNVLARRDVYLQQTPSPRCGPQEAIAADHQIIDPPEMHSCRIGFRRLKQATEPPGRKVQPVDPANGRHPETVIAVKSQRMKKPVGDRSWILGIVAKCPEFVTIEPSQITADRKPDESLRVLKDVENQ
jgi:hypothetical protein